MLKNFILDLRRNIVKLICLTLGMTVGMVLIAKIYYEKTYDLFFPEIENIYVVEQQFLSPDGSIYDFERTPGAHAPAMKRYVPQVENATRYSYLGDGYIIIDGDKKYSNNGIRFTDSCFFDVFKTRIIVGNPHEILSVSKKCMIPKSLADKIEGDPIGQKFIIKEISPDLDFVIGGIYQDFPDNSIIPNGIYLSMSTMDALGWSGYDNWVGNDRYNSFVKLYKNTDSKSVSPSITKMLQENIPSEILERNKMNLILKPMLGYHEKDSDIKDLLTLLVVLTILILLCSSVNYLLIVIGQISGRAKVIAIRKCFGTGNTKLFFLIMKESILDLIVSACLAVVVIFALGDVCENLLGVSPRQLFSVPYVWLTEVLIILVLLIITGVIPSIIYCNTPVISAFREKVRKRKAWKLAMLSVEFAISGFLISLLVLVGRQYHLINHFDVGYNYDNIGLVNIFGPEVNLGDLKNELKRLSCISEVACGTQNFVTQASGGEIYVDRDVNKSIQIADLLNVDREIFDVLGLRFIQGGTFHEYSDSIAHEIVVEERLIDALRTQFGIEDSDIIGKTFLIPHHDPVQEYRVCGVINNFHRGGFEESGVDLRPGIFFPSKLKYYARLYIKFTEMNPENIHAAQEVINAVFDDDDHESYITPYGNQFEYYTGKVQKFETAILIVGITILLIALLGLLGFVADDVENRSKEIAVRKVTGSSEIAIIKLFCRDITIAAIPSLVIGAIIAMIVGKEWLSRFYQQVSLSPVTFVLCVFGLLLLIISVVIINSMKIARSNPVIYLRNE